MCIRDSFEDSKCRFEDAFCCESYWSRHRGPAAGRGRACKLSTPHRGSPQHRGLHTDAGCMRLGRPGRAAAHAAGYSSHRKPTLSSFFWQPLFSRETRLVSTRFDASRLDAPVWSLGYRECVGMEKIALSLNPRVATYFKSTLSIHALLPC